ncbi:hypothetical protein HOLleu_32204 [Holothuria leucospilota]|uniref:Uncharacterized protein n=1 Tax=Holothuria leucospilota TaxID=206669 RepID=A0A9Q0YSX4_HOLLE|nr:hypothetical protein HOLleu_32204 [Holothuria leucospilota]
MDLKIQRCQKPLVKALTALTVTLSKKELSSSEQDALALFSNSVFEMNMLRKELIKPELQQKFAENGILNQVADKSSRVFNDQLEWMLNRQVFRQLCDIFGTPDIDLFASRLNAQLNRYISWKPDPGSESVDAFLVDWQPYFFYAFPPFSLVGKCLCKIEQDQAEGCPARTPGQRNFKPGYRHYLVIMEGLNQASVLSVHPTLA